MPGALEPHSHCMPSIVRMRHARWPAKDSSYGGTRHIDGSTEHRARNCVQSHEHELHGIESLAPRERRYAQIAHEHLSNNDIPQAQFVALKTVQQHLCRHYRKLELSSRKQLE